MDFFVESRLYERQKQWNIKMTNIQTYMIKKQTRNRKHRRAAAKLLDGSHNLESYVDDVLGHTENWSKHMEILRDFLNE